MDLEKSDKLTEINTTIDEGFKPYYTDVFTPGEVKEQLRIGEEVLDSTSSKKYCFSYLSANQSITNASGTVMGVDTYETNDTLMSATTNRITITTAGQYLCTASATFANNTTGIREVWFRVSGGSTYRGDITLQALNAQMSVLSSAMITLAVGDYVDFRVYQNSGGALNIIGGPEFSYFHMSQL